MNASNTILLIQGDAEASLLADAESALQALYPGSDAGIIRAWAPRPDGFSAGGPGLPLPLVASGALPAVDVRALLEQPHRIVVLSVLSAVVLPAYRHRDGGVFLPHRALRAQWTPGIEAVIANECAPEPPLSPEDAVSQLVPVIEQLMARDIPVAVTVSFRHVCEPLAYRLPNGAPTVRELVRRTNLEIMRLSQRTGCFVLDFDRVLAQEGGAALGADCFGGGSRAAEIALDEFAAVLLDALPDGLAVTEV